ncbi:MAG: hypothetical protein JSU92_12400, partial [Deltaproteobacteria bacterium]
RWFGFEHVFFAFDAPFVGNNQMVHHAITDIQEGQFHYTYDYASGTPPYVENGFVLSLGVQTAEGGDGNNIIHGEVDNYTLDLELNTVKAPVLQYGDGYENFPQIGMYTYYYSRERMEAAGTLTIGGETLSVTGTAWFDHQWGSLSPQSVEWDWFAIQLDDNREIMISILNGAGGPIIGGSFTDENCITTEIDPSDLTVTALGSWESPYHPGQVYPMGWDISIRNISRGGCMEDLNLTVIPVMEDQELTFDVFTTIYYWEGAAVVSGDAEGRAYIEMNPGFGCSTFGSGGGISRGTFMVNWVIYLLPLVGLLSRRLLRKKGYVSSGVIEEPSQQ